MWLIKYEAHLKREPNSQVAYVSGNATLLPGAAISGKNRWLKIYIFISALGRLNSGLSRQITFAFILYKGALVGAPCREFRRRKDLLTFEFVSPRTTTETVIERNPSARLVRCQVSPFSANIGRSVSSLDSIAHRITNKRIERETLS